MGIQSSQGGVIRTHVLVEVATLLDQAWVAKVVVGDLRVATLTECIGMRICYLMTFFRPCRRSFLGSRPVNRLKVKSNRKIKL